MQFFAFFLDIPLRDYYTFGNRLDESVTSAIPADASSAFVVDVLRIDHLDSDTIILDPPMN